MYMLLFFLKCKATFHVYTSSHLTFIPQGIFIPQDIANLEFSEIFYSYSDWAVCLQAKSCLLHPQKSMDKTNAEFGLWKI